MTQKLPNYIERNIIEGWLRGKSRDEIAIENSISTGSISNIMKNFVEGLGHCDAETIRELAIQIRKANLTPKDCAIGFRINKILENIGMTNDEEYKIEVFLKEIDRLVTKINLDPSLIRECVYELIKISHDISSSTQMINYIQQKKEEKERLESKVENLKDEMRKLEKVKSDTEERFISTKNKICITSDELDWYINIRDSLEKEGVPVENISLLSRLVSKIKKYGNNLDIFHILQRIDKLEKLEKEIEAKDRLCNLRRRDIEILKEQDLKLLDSVYSTALKLDLLDEIEKMGFTFVQLKKLKLRLTEIAIENKMNPEEIKEEFFDNISLYANKITIQKELERLNKSVSEVEKLLHKKRSNFAFQGMAEKIVQDLVDKGMDESDIIFLNEFIEMVDGYGLKTKDLIEFMKWVRVQYGLQSKNDVVKETLKLNNQVKNNNIRNPYPFCIEKNILFIFHPLINKIYSIPNS